MLEFCFWVASLIVTCHLGEVKQTYDDFAEEFMEIELDPYASMPASMCVALLYRILRSIEEEPLVNLTGTGDLCLALLSYATGFHLMQLEVAY